MRALYVFAHHRTSDRRETTLVPHYRMAFIIAMSPAEPSLLAAIGEGDTSAFWTLWESVSSELFELCLRSMHGNRVEAEDALERAMMKAFVKLPSFARQIVSPKAWLFRITSNVCNDIHRERARLVRATAHFAVLATQDREADDRDDREHADPEPERLISLLPRRLREVFVLRVIQKMSYKEIAVRLDITSVNARKRVQQARSALRTIRHDGDLGLLDSETAAERRPMSRVMHVVRVRLPSGSESDLEIAVETTPCRARRRIVTLRMYVRRHPSGWKMRLRLADLLYASGEWTEAAEGYEIVLRKRPSLAVAASRLQTIHSYPTMTTV